ncbi:hypothetical protein AQUCO_09100051v1 [Aquilegia coerulea]|uniref:Uncharacterized protein n=1 Tax=Aquilegia coerulea TaxID=218851 RepID=A0A2G5C5P6_AQUCA|nr:hypothetical protein AQUCO_09100051v1 [Aquilegia coerulea]
MICNFLISNPYKFLLKASVVDLHIMAAKIATCSTSLHANKDQAFISSIESRVFSIPWGCSYESPAALAIFN